ncbi:MAG: CIA30 family protein [Polyangiaceae bacterium]|nr:CIA30 family protein [Polyangiaceae bacterium]
MGSRARGPWRDEDVESGRAPDDRAVPRRRTIASVRRSSSGSGARRLARTLGALAASCLLPSCVQSWLAKPVVPGGAERTLFFRGVRLFDGTTVAEQTNLAVVSGKISRVGPQVPPPAGATIIDGGGLTVLPGFIDAHTHTWRAEHLRQAAVLGVTTELDMLGKPSTLKALKEALANGELGDAADLRSAGNPVLAPGGHGSEYGLKLATITNPADVFGFITARVNEGSDYIKIIYDDGSLWGEKWPTPELPLLRAAIDAAHASRRLVVVHAGRLEEARDAFTAGADGFAHLWLGDPDEAFASHVRQRGMFVVPTLSVLLRACGEDPGSAVLADPSLAPYVARAEQRALKRKPWKTSKTIECDQVRENFKVLVRQSVPLLAGSDAGNPGVTHGATLHGELEYLVQGGMTPVAALAAATSAPANAFRLTDRGRIARGLRADLLVVEGDPTRDIRATRRIVTVYREGAPVDRAAYLQGLAAAAPPGGPLPPSAPRVIGDFEAEGALDSGFAESTDRIKNGLSVVTLSVVPDGAAESAHALHVEGNVLESQVAFPWAGVGYYPGSRAMEPTDLSGYREISFYVRGDGAEYDLLFFFGEDERPARQTFIAGPDWTMVRFPFTDFDGTDARDVAGIFFAAGKPGPFAFDLDRVELR